MDFRQLCLEGRQRAISRRDLGAILKLTLSCWHWGLVTGGGVRLRIPRRKASDYIMRKEMKAAARIQI